MIVIGIGVALFAQDFIHNTLGGILK
jgi:hypothetical protein